MKLAAEKLPRLPKGRFFLLSNLVLYPPRSLGMCGLIELHVFRQGVTDVLHFTREELKTERLRLSQEGWIITFTKVL